MADLNERSLARSVTKAVVYKRKLTNASLFLTVYFQFCVYYIFRRGIDLKKV
jgi:hypothetical protein